MTDNPKRLERLERQYAEIRNEVKAVLEMNQILLDLILEERPHLKHVVMTLKGKYERNQ